MDDVPARIDMQRSGRREQQPPPPSSAKQEKRALVWNNQRLDGPVKTLSVTLFTGRREKKNMFDR